MKTLTVENTGSATLTLTQITQSDLPTGFTLVAPLGSTSLAAGATTSFTIALDTSLVGNYSGTLSIANNDSDESPFDITLNGSVTAPVTELIQIIDDEDSGYTSTAGWRNYFLGDGSTTGYNQDVEYVFAGDGSQQAAWDFTDLPAGTYDVSVSWAVLRNMTFEAPYSVYDGTQLLQTVLVDQRISPDEFDADNHTWERFGQFEITGDTLRVVLTNDVSSGLVIADAVRIELVAPANTPQPLQWNTLLTSSKHVDRPESVDRAINEQDIVAFERVYSREHCIATYVFDNEWYLNEEKEFSRAASEEEDTSAIDAIFATIGNGTLDRF